MRITAVLKRQSGELATMADESTGGKVVRLAHQLVSIRSLGAERRNGINDLNRLIVERGDS